jgi:methionine aminopeptidase
VKAAAERAVTADVTITAAVAPVPAPAARQLVRMTAPAAARTAAGMVAPAGAS